MYLEDDVMGTSHLIDFYSHIRQFLSEIVQSGVRRLPLCDEVLHDLTRLDPRERITSNVSAVRRLAQKFLGFVPAEKVDN